MRAQRARKEEEKVMPMVVAKDNKTKMITARVAPSKGVEGYCVETEKKTVEHFWYREITVRSDSEPAIVAPEEAVRREIDVEIVEEDVPVGDHQANGLV